MLLFVLTLWWAAHWQDAAACPYVHVENYLEGTNDLSYSTLCCLAEMAGGFAIYRYSYDHYCHTVTLQYYPTVQILLSFNLMSISLLYMGHSSRLFLEKNYSNEILGGFYNIRLK